MISPRRPVAPQSALSCANAGPQGIDPVTRVSSRIELPEPEFKWIGPDLYLHRARGHLHRMLQADSSQSRQHARLTKRDRLVLSARGFVTDRYRRKTTMISFK